MWFSLSDQAFQNQASLLACLLGSNNINDGSSASNLQIPTANHQQRDHETEQALRAAFNELSRNEQVKALTDMYAFPGSASLEENPAMVNRLLRDFEEEVQRE